MANNNSENKIGRVKAIGLVQQWGSGKIAIGSKFKMQDNDRVLTLCESEGYPNGRFLFDDGEAFDIGKYFESFFIELEKEQEQSNQIYNEDFWNAVDDIVNPKLENGDNENRSAIRKTFFEEQKNESFHDFVYYDVSEIIERIIDDEKENETSNKKFHDNLNEYLNIQNYPFFTKDKLTTIFNGCKLEQTSTPEIFRVKLDNKHLGYLVRERDKYFFAPKSKAVSDEYTFEDDNSTGFFYTADSYLDIALSTIEKYKEEFVTLFHSDSKKNRASSGYQADATVKTLLAFSCECYLKSLLISNGKNLTEIKGIGHGLSELFTALDDEQIAYVFNHMEKNGYNLENPFYQATYETNNLTDKFMLDLARIDNAYIDARYSAEKDKNTNYSFLYRFALALRQCVKKDNMLNSPFSISIENKINK